MAMMPPDREGCDALSRQSMNRLPMMVQYSDKRLETMGMA